MGLYGGSGGDSSAALKDPQSSVVSIILSLEEQHLRTNCPTRLRKGHVTKNQVARLAERRIQKVNLD